MASSNVSGNHFNSNRGGIQNNDSVTTPYDNHIEHLPDPLDKLRPAQRASYKTRPGAEGDQPRGCMPDTRLQIIADLKTWAWNETAPKVYWLHGHLGTGKTSIAHTLSEHLDREQMLGASYFCSRSALWDASRIIPTIATMLARSDPEIRLAIYEVLTRDPDVADLNSLSEQFSSLIVNPIKRVINKDVRIYKVIVIDALDECFSPWVVESLIKTILNGVEDIPVKFFMLSRPEDWIKRAFRRIARPSLLQEFCLHDVAKSDVQSDVKTYLRSALSEIAEARSFSEDDPLWPPEEELNALLVRSDGLFIYAATAARYIGARGVNFRQRLTEIVQPGPPSMLQANTINNLYLIIIVQAFERLEDRECILRRDVLSSVVLVQTPLSISGMTSLLDMPNGQIKADLSPFHSVIHVPSGRDGHISIFHASFREFIIDPARCGDGYHVDADKGHELLTLRCLGLLNKSLRRNICNLREGRFGTLAHRLPDLSVIPEALKYSCLYWAVHLADAFSHPLADVSPMVEHLRTFVDEHLLHWFECLSVIGELETGLKSLAKANETLSIYASACADFKPIAMLFEDARQCLQMGFDAIKHHCLNTYHPVLMWLPKKSLIREKYRALLGGGAQVMAGLTESWGPMEHAMHHPGVVCSAAFSGDGTRVVSGSADSTVRIWNATTGEMERTLEGHSGSVRSVAFSSDGTRVVSGSHDKSVLIWNVNTGEIEYVLEGHSRPVVSVAISHDGTRVVSGSTDNTVRIWNADTGKIDHVLDGHSDCVTSVAISHDGTRVVSGSDDQSVRIWNMMTRETVRIFEGHSKSVLSVAISHDGTCLVSGSQDYTIRIWNAATGELRHTLKDHSPAVALSCDGTRVCGSGDNSIRIWNAATGEIERVLKGQPWPQSVAFSPDGTRVLSSSADRTVRIWNATAQVTGHVPEGHSGLVVSVAFSHDGARMISSSLDGMVKVWNVCTGEVELLLRGHSDWVTSVAFSRDGTRVVSGFVDNSVRIWNAVTGDTESVLKGHSAVVCCVAFSHDGTRVVSGSYDRTVRIWNVTTGNRNRVLNGHSSTVASVAFSRDGTRIVSGSYDKTLRIWNVVTGEIERVFKGDIKMVQSVAFSPDGTHVASGSLETLVLIWNATTGKSTSLPYSESFQFPDNSKVTHIFPGWFQFFTPNQGEVCLSLNKKWILTGRPTEACWIPPQFRDFQLHAISGSNVCLGCQSGRVVIVDLKPLH